MARVALAIAFGVGLVVGAAWKPWGAGAVPICSVLSTPLREGAAHSLKGAPFAVDQGIVYYYDCP